MATARTAMKPYIIAIAGGSGSGKTTVAEKLLTIMPDARIIHLDDFYKDFGRLPQEERTKVNYDHPDAIDWALLRRKLHELKHGTTITAPCYSFVTHSRAKHTQEIAPAQVIIIEGILALHDKECNRLSDLRIFVHADTNIRFSRRLGRDIRERGRTAESVIAAWRTNVKPMHDRFVEPSKRHAHIILANNNR